MSGLLDDGLDAEARLLVSRAFTSLWHGTSPLPRDVAGAVDPAEAAEVFGMLAAAGRCELDSDGRIVGVHGITRTRTRHQMTHGAGRHHTWCAFDAVGIPAAMGIHATAETACPRCDVPIAINIVDGEPRDAKTTVVWLPSDTGAHLIEDFCSKSNVFCSSDHLDLWLDGSPRHGNIVSLTEAADLGRSTWADVANVVPRGDARR